MVKVVGAIAGSVIVGIVGLVVGLLVKFRHDWNYMRKLRSRIKSKIESKDNCECWMPCGLSKIFFGHFLCRCCCCKVKKPENSEKDYDITDWEDFLKNESITITQNDLKSMRKKYINYHYSHRNYCFKKPRKGSNYPQCFHDETVDWKGLIQHPVLYLLALNFDEVNKIYWKMNAGKRKKRDSVIKWNVEELNPLEFVFKGVLGPENNQYYQNIEKTISKKAENICLVIENFPRKYKKNFEEDEIYTLNIILALHQLHNVRLIYNVR